MYFCTYVSATLIVLVNLCPYKFGRFILPMILQVLSSRLSGPDVFTQKKSARLAKRQSDKRLANVPGRVRPPRRASCRARPSAAS